MDEELRQMVEEVGESITGKVPDISPRKGCPGVYAVGFRYGHYVYVANGDSRRGVLQDLRRNSQDVIRLMEYTIEKIDEQLGELE
jgi:hypothetical protein